MTIGTLVSMYRKGYLLSDEQTTMSRKATLPDTAFYAGTSSLPLFSLDLYLMFTLSIFTFFLKVGQYIYRAPEEENLLGMTKPFSYHVNRIKDKIT